MNKMKLVVSVSAKFEWLEPPKNIEEEAMREHADIRAMEAASKLNVAAQLLVLEILNA